MLVPLGRRTGPKVAAAGPLSKRVSGAWNGQSTSIALPKKALGGQLTLLEFSSTSDSVAELYIKKPRPGIDRNEGKRKHATLTRLECNRDEKTARNTESECVQVRVVYSFIM